MQKILKYNLNIFLYVEVIKEKNLLEKLIINFEDFELPFVSDLLKIMQI